MEVASEALGGGPHAPDEKQLSEKPKFAFKFVKAAPPVAKKSQSFAAIPTRPRAVASQVVLAFDVTVKAEAANGGA